MEVSDFDVLWNAPDPVTAASQDILGMVQPSHLWRVATCLDPASRAGLRVWCREGDFILLG